MIIRLHAFEPASRANGPGLRAVVWFQGCSLRCPGCFNPDTHDPEGGYATETADLASAILAASNPLEGLSVSGGEPFEQPEALLDLLTRLERSRLSIVIFSGYTLDALRRLRLGPAILARTDVLIAGPYQETHHLGRGLLGSSNQRIHLLTNRYTQADFTGIPIRELILHRDGTVVLSGVSPLPRSE